MGNSGSTQAEISLVTAENRCIVKLVYSNDSLKITSPESGICAEMPSRSRVLASNILMEHADGYLADNRGARVYAVSNRGGGTAVGYAQEDRGPLAEKLVHLMLLAASSMPMSTHIWRYEYIPAPDDLCSNKSV